MKKEVDSAKMVNQEISVSAASYPLVSIIATCYNHEKFALDCLNAIKAQTYPNLQIIIADDCSTDRSVELIDRWILENDLKCVFIKHSVNVGLNKTLNEALSISKGEYIAHISTDDLWMPQFITTYVNEIQKRSKDYGLVYGNSFVIDELGHRMNFLRKRPDFHPEGRVLKDLVKETFLTSQAIIMKKSYLEMVGNYDERLIFEDFDIWTRLAEVCSFAYCPEILASYRVLSTSLSHSRPTKMIESALIIWKRLEETHPDLRQFVEDRKVDAAKELYKLKYPNCKKYLVKLFLQRRTIRNFLFALLALIGFNYSQTNNIIEHMSSLKKAFIRQ